MKLGMFDPPEMVPYSKIDEKELDSAEHRALARTLANESMVLLKNDGTLPLKKGPIKIAVVGPLADQTRYLLGNYNGGRRTRFLCWKGSGRSFLMRKSALSRERSSCATMAMPFRRRPHHDRRAAGAHGGVCHRRTCSGARTLYSPRGR